MDVKRRQVHVGVGSGGLGSSSGAGGASGAGGFPIGDVAPSDAIDGLEGVQNPQNPQKRMEELAREYELDALKNANRVPGQSLGLNDQSLGPNVDGVQLVQGGKGVATYGWKMFEDEELDRLMRQQDVQELLQKIRESARKDPEGTQRFLDDHPILASKLEAAVAQMVPQTSASGFGNGTPMGSGGDSGT